MIHMNGRTNRWVSRVVVCVCAMAAVSAAASAASQAELDTLRQLYEATNIYAFNAPVLVEEMAVTVKLAPDANRIKWESREPGFTVISLADKPNAVVALDVNDIDAVLDYLRGQGEVTVLHTRRWNVLNNTASFVLGGSPPVARATVVRSGTQTPVTVRRDGSTKLTLNIRGIDVSGRSNPAKKVLDFDLTLDMNYVRGESGSAGSTRYETLTVEGRSKLASGHTMLIEDVHGDEAVVFLLTLTLIGD